MTRKLTGFASLLLLSASPCVALAQQVVGLDEVVVTATARPEARSRIAGTVQVIDQARIESSPAKSLTDLAAENAVGFLSEWTPAQTSINIRGGASDGQGRDFVGDVLVLVNGRRAGTSNISKFSPSDVSRIEVVRGSASVAYGSQNIGGVVNIITKSGKTSPGVVAAGSVGSWGLVRGNASVGGARGPFDFYLGVNAGEQGDYHAGKGGGKELNTSWHRRGASFAAGWQIAPEHRLDFNVRSDGSYDTGFRGSASNTIDRDDRFNNSWDLTYAGALGDRLSWNAQAFSVHDVDALHWGSPVVRNATTGAPGPGTSIDFNTRKQNINGLHMRPTIKTLPGNTLLLGYDWERSTLRSTRRRAGVPGFPVAQISPMDNNQTETINAYYFEDAQSLLDERLVLRGGVRRTHGTTDFDSTPDLALALSTTGRSYATTTYSLGMTYRLMESVALRAGASSGFRAPTATQLGADFTAVGGGRTFGNPNLRPETSDQIEIGATISKPAWSLDAVVFRNVISDRITTLLRPGVAATSDYINNPADLYVRGLEVQGNLDVLEATGNAAGPWRLRVFANGYYNFDMKDKGAPATARVQSIQRMYRFEGAFGAHFGRERETAHAWFVEANALLRGHVFYDTEELLLIPVGEPVSTYVHQKPSFWTFNLKGQVQLTRNVSVTGLVNNLFNVNQHPVFIALDRDPRIADARFQNGLPLGTSMPGRNYELRLQAKF